jgi:D-xylose transport system substrate-binding protein
VSGRIRIPTFGGSVRVTLACAVVAGVTAACAGSNPGDGSKAQATEAFEMQDCLVGASWSAFPAFMDWEQPTIAAAIPAAGAQYKEFDAKADGKVQADQIDQLVRDGAKVLIVEGGGDTAYLPAVQRAIKAGVPVISSFTPIREAGTLYVAFDPVEQGRQEARALLAVKPRGTYAIIKGDPTTGPDSDLIAAGILEILQPAVDRGDIQIVASVDTHWWQEDLAKQEMTTILSENGGNVDAVAAETEGLAKGVAQAIDEAGLTGKVAVATGGSYSSYDGFFGVLHGTMTAEVWGDEQRSAAAAAQAALALCRDPDITKLAGSATVTWPGGDPLRVILLPPVTITKDNIEIVLQSSPQWRQWLCNDALYTPDGAPPPACQLWPGPTPTSSASATLFR